MTLPFPRLTLVLGGARSGKSEFAEGLVTAAPPPWRYIATAQAYDDEMRDRIARHVARRGDGWTTEEAPRALAEALAATPAGVPVLVDCLTLWLSNVLLADGGNLEADCDRLLAALAVAPGPLVLISNEVGLSIVPDNALARAFRDAQGRLNQRVAAIADAVYFVAAGLPLILKHPNRTTP